MISRLKLVIEGKYGCLTAILRRRMNAASKCLDYEEAARLRDEIHAVEQFGVRIRLREIRRQTLKLMRKDLALRRIMAMLGLSELPSHMECIDISHWQGRLSVGSVVVFRNGHRQSAEYRHYAIRHIRGIDDCGMLAEVAKRRILKLKENNLALPHILLVDGGKGQVHAVSRSIRSLGEKRCMVLGLAKKKETIITEKLAEMATEPSDPARRLLQEMRDEAHRFALRYFKKRDRRRFLDA